MANFDSPFVTAQGTDTGGYNMAASTWPDFSGSQLQFAQMLSQQSGAHGWYQNQAGFSDVWFPNQAGYTDASMIAALNAKLQTSPELWMQQLMAQAGASQSQMLQQQIMQRQMARASDSAKDGSQAKATAGGASPMPPPGISSTTPVKAGSSVNLPGDKSASKAAMPAMSSERSNNEAGAKAGQLLLNLVNNKEKAAPPQGAGAQLLQQLKGGGAKKTEGPRDDGAGLAILQQVQNGADNSWTSQGGSNWPSWWNPGKSNHQEDWEDWGHGKAGKKGKADWQWNGSDWWTYGQEWSEEGQWPERWAPSAPQWGRQKKGKAKAAGRGDSQDTSDGSNDSDDSDQQQAGANSRWRQRGEKSGRGKGQATDAQKTRWKPAAKSKGK